MIKMLQYKMYPAGELAVLRQLLLFFKLTQGIFNTSYSDMENFAFLLFASLKGKLVDFPSLPSREMTFVTSNCFHVHQFSTEKGSAIKGKNLQGEQILTFYSRPLFRKEVKQFC